MVDSSQVWGLSNVRNYCGVKKKILESRGLRHFLKLVSAKENIVDANAVDARYKTVICTACEYRICSANRSTLVGYF